MQVDRKIGYAPKTTETGQKAALMHARCVGCEDCRGLCREFLELLTLPEAVVREN